MDLSFTFNVEFIEGQRTKVEVCFEVYATKDQWEIRDLTLYNLTKDEKINLDSLQDDEKTFVLRQAEKLANEHADEAYRQRLDMLIEQAMDWAREDNYE